jgi:hypothetical protein
VIAAPALEMAQSSCAIQSQDGPDKTNGFSNSHDNIHVLATTTLGQVWHAFRRPDKKWSAFGNVSAVVGSNAVIGAVPTFTQLKSFRQ